ncbi:C39 family peptidase [Murinocardiopsis flavida]|uniref:C39 family peptidase n=1 Tax=Murinocardiopsis flavida TaxID=645275 RepID=UPI0011B24F5D|nr:C39 family peptidase [Murinocardiopsis flavida]
MIIGAAATVGMLAAGAAPAAAEPAVQMTPLAPADASAEAAPKAAAPQKGAVTHKAWKQQRGNWCVPTSVQLSLRTFGVKVTQSTLAEKMKTEGPGTSGKNASVVYNSYLSSKGYKQTWANGQDASVLMDRVAYDVGVLKKAVPLGVWGKEASWIKAENNFGHAISVRGYDKSKKTFIIWDPADAKYGGHHTVSAKNLAKASQKNGLFYVSKK